MSEWAYTAGFHIHRHESGSKLTLRKRKAPRKEGWYGFLVVEGERFGPFLAPEHRTADEAKALFYAWAMRRVDVPIGWDAGKCERTREGNSGPGGYCPNNATWWIGNLRLCQLHAAGAREDQAAEMRVAEGD